ncbi:conserved hypothetical protein [Coraliomargarita akajimensis DSM 45221]|uniref:Uncharacterized protein n=2 Tax=Coraliomargarita TaxID=442430 RepID=D5EIQ6_CORAD|nr:conserved hypothetical protein [Coraliomargarita akajimensis DSM 45221]
MVNTLETAYGTLHGVTDHKTYKDGRTQSCVLDAANCIQTAVGELIPQYKPAAYGERQKKHRASLSFHANGKLKSAALDSQTQIRTPLRTFDAELVTFYECGSVNRVFPLNGKIDGFWSEKNEGDLAEAFEFNIPQGRFTAKIISIRFYPSGKLKSLTLWPGQHIVLKTPVGLMLVRRGFSLYEDGRLRSVEPSKPMRIATPIGEILAFDPDMVGMHADQNSIQFSPEGAVTAVTTVHTGIELQSETAQAIRIEPQTAPSLIDMEELRIVPLHIRFDREQLSIEDEFSTHTYKLPNKSIQTFEQSGVVTNACAACAGCSGGDSCCTE